MYNEIEPLPGELESTTGDVDDGNDPDTDISQEERELLDSSFEDEEEQGLHAAELDNTDEDGELLNEESSAGAKNGEDLDVPNADEDDEMENIGEEDEENNSYSLSDQDDGEDD